jgi:hypothetical protein
VLQQATDVELCDVRKSGVAVTCEERFLTLPQRLVTMHSRTVVAVQRLRHERRGLSKLVCSIANYVFEYLKVVSRSQQSGITKIDFALSGGSDFVVVAFNRHATLAQSQRDFRTQID